MEIEEKILELITSSKNGILQKELLNKAKIDSNKCSQIINKLEKEGKIIKKIGSNEGQTTYLIRPPGKEEDAVAPEKLTKLGV